MRMVTLLLFVLLAAPAFAQEPTPVATLSPSALESPSPTPVQMADPCVNGVHPTDPTKPCMELRDPVAQLNQRVTFLENLTRNIVTAVNTQAEQIRALLPQPSPQAKGRK